MAMHQVLKKLFRNIRPVMYTSGTLFAHLHTPVERPGVKDKLELEKLDTKRLTYQFMIQQAALDAANSATQALTVTCMTIINLSAEYRTLLNKLIALLTVDCRVNDEHWDLIVEVRTEMEEKKEALMKLTGYMDSVHKMAVAASELSFLSGMDSLSSTLCQRIDDALNNVKAEVGSNLQLEQVYRQIQEDCVKDNK